MIAYDLRCEAGHQFEAWFKDRSTYESQKERRLIECPRCGSTKVEMVFRPRAIRRGGLSRGIPDALKAARKVERFLNEHFEDVGDRFAEEARKVHYGETKPRNIRGETTPGEERELREEGVAFLKVFLPKPQH